MLNKITMYIALSVVISLGVGYGAGSFVTSNKAERDIAAIRAILEEEKAEKKNKEELIKAKSEKDRQEWKEISRQLRNARTKKY